MPMRLPMAVLFLFFLTHASAIAQNPATNPAPTNPQNRCPNGTKSDKVACVIPQVFGINGLNAENPHPNGTFSADFFTDRLRPIQTSVARQAALLPLASPSSGITFSWDPVARVFSSSTDSYGPILGERAETIGRHRVFLGFGYQYFNFDTLDGIDLHNLPVLLTQPDNFNPPGNGQGLDDVPCSINYPNPSPHNTGTEDCGSIRDVIKTTNRLDLRINQFTTFITFGLTNRIDVSVAIPIETVHFGVTSNATIVTNNAPRDPIIHEFAFQPNCTDPCLNQVFSNSGTSAGIADITLRVKGTAWKGERSALALGADFRLPTGDQLNFLGAGVLGVRPFVVWSYRSRISPHVLMGYEANGSSLIGGDLATGTKGKLPSQLTYSAGADVWLIKRVTAAVDIVGQQVFQASHLALISTKDLGACPDSTCLTPAAPVSYSDVIASTGSFNVSNLSLGVKLNPVSNLLVTGNVLIKLNDAGLRANYVPLIGVSYTF